MAIDFEPADTATAPKIDFEPETSAAAPKIDFEPESSPAAQAPPASASDVLSPDDPAMQAVQAGQIALQVAKVPALANARLEQAHISDRINNTLDAIDQIKAQQKDYAQNASSDWLAAHPDFPGIQALDQQRENLDIQAEQLYRAGKQLHGPGFVVARTNPQTGQPEEWVPPALVQSGKEFDQHQTEQAPIIVAQRAEDLRQGRIKQLGYEPGIFETFANQVTSGALDLASQVAQLGQQSGLLDAEQVKVVTDAAHDSAIISDLGKGVAHDIARGGADVLNLVGGNDLIATGKLGAAVAATKAAVQARQRVLDATGDPNKADAAATETFPALLAFMIAGYGAGGITSSLLAKDASAAVRGLANFAGAEVANVGVDSVIHALKSESMDWRALTADTLFALHSGYGGYKDAKLNEAEQAKADAELKSRGFTKDDLGNWTPPPNGSTPAQALVRPTVHGTEDNPLILEPPTELDKLKTQVQNNGDLSDQEKRLTIAAIDKIQQEKQITTEEPSNAQQNTSTSETNGGVRPRGQIQELPPSQSGEGVQPSGQGNGNLEQGVAPSASSEAQSLDQLAEQHGVKYDGSTELPGNPHQFTDQRTGSTFIVKGDVTPEKLAEKVAGVDARYGLEPRNLGPGAANIEEMTPAPLISAKNAAIDEQRAARGLEPLVSEARKPDPVLWDQAMQKIEQNDRAPDQLVQRVNAGKQKTATDVEQTMLLWKIVDLHNKMDTAAQRALDPHADAGDRTEARLQYEQLEQERQATEEADRKVGTEQGRALRARRLMADENYNFVGLMRRVGVVQKEPISPEQTVKIKADAEKVKVAKDKLDTEIDKVGTAAEQTDLATTKAQPKTDVNLDEQREKIRAHLEAEQKKGTNVSDLKSFIQKLAENFVRSGVKDIRELTTAVHGVVAPIFKGITPREVRDLFSGYGEFHPLDKDAVKTELRRLRSEGQSVSKLEDVQGGNAPKKTGVERQAPSDEKRRLEKEVRETMKKNGIVTTDPATQLKSSLDARKTAMKNQIKDLTHQIETGEAPKLGEPPPSDAELDGLRKLRDNVRDTLHAIEGDPKMSDEQRAKLVIAQLDRQIAEHQRIIDSGQVKQEGGKRKLLTTPEIESRRAVRDSLKAQVDEIKAADQGAKEEREFDATMKRADELEKKLASGDLSTKGGKEFGPDTELVAAAKDRLAKLQKELSERRKALRPKATEEERQLSALERQKDELQRRLDTGDLAPKGPKLGPDTEKVAAAKAEVQKLRDEIKARRDALNPKKTVEEIQLARLEKAADELEERLTKGDLSRKEKAPTVDTKEVSKAKDRLATLRDQLKAARAALPEATQAKLDATKAAVEESIAKLDKRIQAEDFASSKKVLPTTPEIETLRAERDVMRKLFNELKSATLPKLTPEQRAQKALATRLANRTAELSAKLAAGDFTKPAPRTPTPLTPALVKAKADYERVKLEVDRGIEKLRLKNRTKFEKVADATAKWVRFGVLTGYSTLEKLTGAAIARVALNVPEEAVGSVARRLFPNVAARAPVEGRGFELGVEAKAIISGLTQGWRDAFKTLSTGHSDLDAAFGHRDVAPRSWLDFVGSLHGALKSNVKRIFFERAQEKLLRDAASKGRDITDPMVQTQIATEAYKEAQRSIFLTNNRIVEGFQAMLARWAAPDSKTGKVSIPGKIAQTAAKVLVPVVRIPANIVSETLGQYVGGLLHGIPRAIGAEMAIRKGASDLQPQEADAIMRSLKKGVIGNALLLLGFFGYKSVGGYYAPGQKRDESKEPNFGEAQIFGFKIPKAFLHNPALEAIQLGATVRRVADSKLRKSDTENQGLMAGIGRALLAASEEVPFIGEAMHLGDLKEAHGGEKFFYNQAKTLTEPQILQQLAKDFDKGSDGEVIKRQEKTLSDVLRGGIPGLRQTVPVKQ